MANFWNIVDHVIEDADILLLICDARMVEQTRNAELVSKVEVLGKPLITVINKCDLVEKDDLEKYKKTFAPCVFVSSHKHFGMTMLRRKILEISRGEPVTIGVLGYPNTGKSSITNAFKGKHSAPTSSVSGHTKGMQRIRVDSKITLLDTPGVLADSDVKSDPKLTITASLNPDKDPDLAAYELLKAYGPAIQEQYNFASESDDPEMLLEDLARAMNRFKSGGVPDTDTAAKMLLQDWQKGKIQL
jgi:hypothetical protein